MSPIATMLTIYSGAKALAKENNIPTNALKYIGSTDCSIISEGAVLLQYNVDMATHPKHKSTIAHKLGWAN